MDIYFSTLDRSKVMQLPVIPPNMPEMNGTMTNEEFVTTTGTITLLGNRAPFSTSIQSFFPTKEYYFAKNKINGWEYVNFFNGIRNKKELLRCSFINNENVDYLNKVVTIENFVYYADKIGDIQYTLDIKEFKTFRG